MTILIFFIAGACGALVKDIIRDNKIKLPKKVNGEFSLGFLGGMMIGGVSGILADKDPVNAFLAGYTGASVIENLIVPEVFKNSKSKKAIEEIIRMIAKQEGVDPDLAVRVAKCESDLDPYAVNINKDGSRDRGIFQINDKYHPEVSDEQAFNIEFSTRFFCKAFKEGHLSWWNATKKCWDK